MRISVFGLGYVGCVSAACLARAGHEVIGVDVNSVKVETIDRGASPIVEPGLGELIASVVANGRLSATTSAAEAIAGTELALICVGTPGQKNGRLDTGILDRVCRTIGEESKNREEPYTVVVRSTILPGTTERVVLPALRDGAGSRANAILKVATNPEFIREGSALDDYTHPPFTVIGSEDQETISRIEQMYSGVEAPFVSVPIRTAEMVKYAFNSFHALKVCFANEIGDACEALGADAQDVMRVFCMDHKLNISGAYLKPGFAFGGSCLPKDIRALTYAARVADADLPLISSIMPSNQAQIEHAVTTVLETGKRRIGIVGLSFKPNTDDLRESPLVTLVETLIGKGCEVKILDRHVSMARIMGANRRYIEEEIPHIASVLCTEYEQLLNHAQVLVVGNAGEDTRKVLEAASPEHIIVDLTRSTTYTSPGETREQQRASR